MPYYFYKTTKGFDATLRALEAAIYTPVADLKATAWVTPKPVPFAERQTGEMRRVAVGDTWGKLWDCAWFHFEGTVPASAQGQQVVLLIDLSGEGCVVDATGCPVLGLTTQSSTYDYTLGRPGKRVVPFLDRAGGGEMVDLWVDAGNNDLFGEYRDNGILKEAAIAVFDEAVFGLYHDFRVLADLLKHLPDDRARYHQVLFALHRAAQQLSDITPESVARAREIVAPELAKAGGSPSLKLSAIGHAHIDLAWLWPIRETIRKGARTFATVLHMMERYPDYVFGASQPQLYQWMKDHYPRLYARIRQKVAEGRWEVQGAMWVEADTNLPGGEALVRQLLYGKQFFREEFGIEPRTLWLPDVFGYTGSLPQILKKSGVDYFMTQKLSWNTFNVFPHHTFLWEGIDGSRVLAHMPPENTYNSAAEPHSLLAAEKNFADKAVSDACLLLFGIGDGGGGPGTSHLEALAREKNLDGLPPVTQEYAEAFFDRVAQGIDRYKTWVGELYLERHQGTYTTQARSKWFNRKLEIALRELELWATLTGSPYPHAELDAIWKEMLLYQFHDILPGSSITRVYDESLARYAEMLDEVERLTAQTRVSLAQQVDAGGCQQPVLVQNSLSWEREEWVRVGETWLKVNVPAVGYAVCDLAAKEPPPDTLSAGPARLENDILTIRFDEQGAISSVFDKVAGREVLTGPGNVLAVYTDHGDAWDMEHGYRERPPARFKLVDAAGAVEGPQAVLAQRYTFGHSTLEQRVILTAGSRRIDFVTRVDWREEHKMLRTSFPVAVRSQQVTCDIQFGAFKRPTHRNTSWDVARQEICAHKWVDLSQDDYGVALLNDCKYGHYVEGNVIDLNLLRSPTYPDPVADRAVHRLTYALYPHLGNHVTGRVLQAGYELNVPLQVTLISDHQGSAPARHSYLEVTHDGVIIEAVKRAEDERGVIIRLYEAHGSHARTRVGFGFPVRAASLNTLMEQHIASLPIVDGGVELAFEPFEIMTLRLE